MTEKETKLRAAGYGNFIVDGALDPRFTFKYLKTGWKHYATCSADLDDIPLRKNCPANCRFCALQEDKLFKLPQMIDPLSILTSGSHR